MEKLDFSGISTEELRYSCEEYSLNGGQACCGINCTIHNCPLNAMEFCDKASMTYEDVNKLFKEELERREKDMNKQPVLESGMIVEFTVNPGDKLLYINDEWLMSLKNNGWSNFKGSLTRKDVSKIYKCNYYIKGYADCLNNTELIWSRKSDKDIKIEEIQKKMDELSKEMEELKG